ncbi:hypothetical protein [Streptomyces sp. Ag109_G2-15]|uniref:hypothetical protein n=1 Tax=Streptomyces sp. Ag109_G2-15 TaxID=1938850 RepID=UPI000BCA23DE|nr:hypothetical protein [Streptomyces sp. Ag109_G2-15]SOD87446.1 hypothetical protein SAMN06272765_4933 [Streptomyces sp. Ag109_G2-15]
MADEADDGLSSDPSDFEGDVPELPENGLRGGHATVDDDLLPEFAVGIPLPSAPPAPPAQPPDSASTG